MEIGEFGPLGVIALVFAPAFVCGALLRSKGLIGWLAIAGIVGIAALLVSGFSGWRLGVGAISALVGLAVGGKLSDARELARMKQAAALEKKARDDRLKKKFSE